MNQKKVTINIVTWNSLTYLPSCLSAVFNQTFNDFQVLIIDNASNDGTVAFIEQNYPEVKILRNTQNLGYARAHNQGIKLTKSDYVLIMNPDVILTPDYLKKMVEAAEKSAETSAFGGKILKFHFQPDELKEIIFTDIIDTVGLKIYRNRNVVNLGENEKNEGQYEEEKEVFGISGGLLFIRRDALEKAAIAGEYFDENFFVYKEDIDLAWRMNIFGLKSLYIPAGQAYHHRQADQPREKTIRAIRESRRKKSKMINYYSTRNHFFLLVKNDFFKNQTRDFIFIFFRELKRFFYILFFETKSLKAYRDFFLGLGKMRKKRRLILKNKKAWENFRKWIE